MKPDPRIARRRYHANPTEANRKLLSASDRSLLRMGQEADAEEHEGVKWDWDRMPTPEQMQTILDEREKDEQG